MSINYLPNGNIDTKTGVGQYGYDLSKPHAVSRVANDALEAGNQTITYTPFNKVSGISQQTLTGTQTLAIEYGPDRERVKSVLSGSNGGRVVSYAGNYERVGMGARYYIYAGDGLAAIYAKTHNSTSAADIYYVHKDHLGSIVRLTRNNGATLFRASYDAWGKRTVTANSVMFLRGYTGHEHLLDYDFDLINMNGRVYDPTLARFLSPDPYVQMPDFSQNFNRYSYCLNNPLIYTDPSGEFWWIAIAAGIGGAINLATHWDQIDSFGDGLAAFGIGAAAGGLAAFTGGATLAAYGGAVGAGGFIGGAAASGMAYTTGAIVQSGGNFMAFGDQMPTAEQFFTGLGFSMVTGGTLNGIISAASGGNFMTGPKMPQPTVLTPTQSNNNVNNSNSQSAQNSQINNPVPEKVAHVVPANAETNTLGHPSQDRVFVTAAEDIKGLNAQQLSLKLGIEPSPSGYKIYEFKTPVNGIASPIKFDNPLFIGRGLTIGGLREFTIPNQQIPYGVTIFRINF